MKVYDKIYSVSRFWPLLRLIGKLLKKALEAGHGGIYKGKKKSTAGRRSFHVTLNKNKNMLEKTFFTHVQFCIFL